MPPIVDTSVPSSPDPLGNSSLAETPFLSPTKPAMHRTPLNKATRTPIKNSTNNIKLQDFILKTPPAGLLRRAQSPTKSTAKTENLLSPWRIRVTVEAERDEDKKGAGGRTSEKVGRSTKKGTGRTTTTLVPLKGLEDSSPPPASRRSARSRKSDVGSSPIKRGGVAALVRKRGRRTTSGEDDAGRDLSVGATPGKRGRGRPRKSLPVIDDEDVVMMEAEAGKSEPAATPLVKKARGKRKAISPVNIPVDEDLDRDVFGQRRKRRLRNSSIILGGTSPNRSLSDSPRKVVSAAHSPPTAVAQPAPSRDSLKFASQQEPNNLEKETWHSATPSNDGHPLLNTAVAHDDSIGDDRAMLADPTNDHREFDSILESEGFSMVSLESIESARQNLSGIANRKLRPQAESTRANFLTDTALQPPRLGDGVPKIGFPSATDAVQDGAIANLQEEADLGRGTTRVLDSDLQHSQCGGDSRNTSSLHQPKSGTEKSVSFSAQNHVIGPDSSEVSARQASVPRGSPTETQPTQQNTPVKVQPTPRLPPPIQQGAPLNPPEPTSKPKRDTPKLSRIVRAGITLQGVLDSNARETYARASSLKSPYVSPANKGSSNAVAGKSPKERLDDLFEGFSAGTRRELRAGLRLGEELARRHKLAAQAQQVGEPSAVVASGDDVLTAANDAGYPKLPTPEDKDDYALAAPAPALAPQQAIEYPSFQPEQLLSPERSEREEDEMDWQVDTPVKAQNLNLSDSISSQDVFNETVASTFSERRQKQWQREREAISRQIEMANSSQVIVINSDDTDAANQRGTLQDDDGDVVDVDICQAVASSNNNTRASPSVDGDLFPEEVVKPRRGKIPSPWRRDSQIVYSDEATEDPSGLFWQPDQRAIQLAKEREERRRRKEGHLDVSGMLKKTEKVKEETRVIAVESKNADIQRSLQNEVEATVKQEQILQVETIVEGSDHSEEAMVTAKEEQYPETESNAEDIYDSQDDVVSAQNESSPEIEFDREDSYYSEDAIATAHGDQTPEVVSDAEDLYDSEEDVAVAEGEQNAEMESTAETTYYSEAEAEEEAEEEASQAPSSTELANIITERYLHAYVHFIRTHPPEPQPTPPTTWLSRLTHLATYILQYPFYPDTWTDAEYHLLDELYQRAKRDGTLCAYNPANAGLWGFRLCLGHTLRYWGPTYHYTFKIGTTHLGVVDKFRDMVRVASLRQGGDGTVEWGEYQVVCRLFSLMVAEDMRARGIPVPGEEEEEEREAERLRQAGEVRGDEGR